MDGGRHKRHFPDLKELYCYLSPTDSVVTLGQVSPMTGKQKEMTLKKPKGIW